MKISGFTFVKNATKLFIPVKESILSILPIVDEFIVAVGDNDADDRTMDEIESIGSQKIKIIHTTWDPKTYKKNTVFAQQTDIAKEKCTGDWLFYLQSDEVIHEDFLETIKNDCRKYLDKPEVDGFLFGYKHFWGDFRHYHVAHSWYPKEIRIIRNDPKVHSWRDAQSFRKFSVFGYSPEDYWKKEHSAKLHVVETKASVYHYGYVRPPEMMAYKDKSNNISFFGADKVDQMKVWPETFDYGPLQKLKEYTGTQPKVLEEWVKKFDWQGKLQYAGKIRQRPLHKHERLKYRILSFVENTFLGGRKIGGFKNYIKIKG